MTYIGVVMLALLVCLGIIIAYLLVTFVKMGHMLSHQVLSVAEPQFHYAGSYTDTFHVTMLQVARKPHYLMEHIQVRCQNDMRARIWVADIEKTGMFCTNNADGQVYYRDGNPDILQDTADADAVSGFSTCRIVFRVFTTSSNTVWHTRMSIGTTNVVGGFENAGGTDSTLPTQLKISGVQTNWTGAYLRDSELRLANLGHYKIPLSIK